MKPKAETLDSNLIDPESDTRNSHATRDACVTRCQTLVLTNDSV